MDKHRMDLATRIKDLPGLGAGRGVGGRERPNILIEALMTH